MTPSPSVAVVARLGVAQTLAWASSYYLPAMLAGAMARDVGVSVPTIFAAFSLALLVSALLGPLAGRAIDRRGGRPVLVATNLVFAVGLVVLATANDAVQLFAGWLILGIGMGSGLYEAAFAALVRLYGRDARGAITGITLVAGFASTVGWPLSSWLEARFGWRGACLTWAALHLVIGIPLNALLPKTSAPAAPASAAARATRADGPAPAHRRAGRLLALVFAVTWFISTAMAAHLPRLLQAAGATLATAVLAGALVGPAQVVARLLEYGMLRRAHPLWSARLASLMHPAGAAALFVFGAAAAVPFALLHGAGNGVLTIAKGTLPLALFGPDGYGLRQGVLMVPARIAQALAPWVFGLMLDRWGAYALWGSTGIGLAAFGALVALPRQVDEPVPVAPVDAAATT